MLSEINQTQKDKYCMISLICGICNSHKEAENRRVVTRGWGEGEMGRCWSKGTKFQLWRINTLWRSTVKKK